MENSNTDITITVNSENNKSTVTLDCDTSCTEVIFQFANMIRGVTYITPSIINSLREVADQFEEDAILVKDDK